MLIHKVPDLPIKQRKNCILIIFPKLLKFSKIFTIKYSVQIYWWTTLTNVYHQFSNQFEVITKGFVSNFQDYLQQILGSLYKYNPSFHQNDNIIIEINHMVSFSHV